MKNFCHLPSFFSAMASCTSSRILSLALGLISLILGPTEKHKKKEKNCYKVKVSTYIKWPILLKITLAYFL